MKFYNLIVMFVLLFSTAFTCSANVPSASQVEATIASGDYPEARKQLAQVLKEYPESYVANRYLFEIIKIENGRDNVTSVEYKIFKERLLAVEASIAKRKAAEAKALADKKSAENNKKIVNFLLFLMLVVFLVAIAFLGIPKLRQMHEESQEKKEREKEFQAWSSKVTADLLDLEQGFSKASLKSLSSRNNTFLEDLSADNADAMQQVLLYDVNRNAVNLHIKNAKEFLKDNGVYL